MKSPEDFKVVATSDSRPAAEKVAEKRKEILLFIKSYIEKNFKPFLRDFKEAALDLTMPEMVINLWLETGRHIFIEGDRHFADDEKFNRLCTELINDFSQSEPDLNFDHEFAGSMANVFHNMEAVRICKEDKREEGIKSAVEEMGRSYQKLVNLLDQAISATEIKEK